MSEWTDIDDHIRALPWRQRIALWFARRRMKKRIRRLAINQNGDV